MSDRSNQVTAESRGLGVRAYARRIGVTHPAVVKAIKRGRLSQSVKDGRIIDPDLADQEWAANRKAAPPAHAEEEGDLWLLDVDDGPLIKVLVGLPLNATGPLTEKEIANSRAYTMTPSCARELARNLVTAADAWDSRRR